MTRSVADGVILWVVSILHSVSMFPFKKYCLAMTGVTLDIH